MLIISIVSTKGGVGKTTVTATLGAFLADAGLKVLMIDLDIQPTLSSYYKLLTTADCGVFEFIAANEQDKKKLISHTAIHRLDLIFSNDPKGQLNTLLLHAPDGRFRLKNLLPIFEPDYDIVLIDTQGARSVILEMAIVASHRLISPVTPEALSAREFRRGTLELLEDMQCYKHLGISLPKVEMLINRVPSVSNNAKLIQKMMCDVFQTKENIKMIQTTIPAIEVYGRSTILSQPVHRIETKKPTGRVTPAAADTIHSLARELFPDWSNRFKEVLAKPSGGKNAP